MRATVDIYEWASLAVISFRRGSVVLDRSTRSIFELTESGALALDILADRPSVACRDQGGDILAAAFRVLPAIRRELLGEHVLAPGDGLTFEDRIGRPLLRRFAEPVRWGRTRPGRFASPQALELSSIVVRTAAGAIVLLGWPRNNHGALRAAFAALGVDGVASEVIEIHRLVNEGAPMVSHALGEPCTVREVWLLTNAGTSNLVLARLGDPAAFVGVLALLGARPDEQELQAFASMCVSTPHFRATVPASADALAATIRGYGAL